MPEIEEKTVSQIILAGWKQLANCDQSDADEIAKILREVLESLEAIEGEGK